VLRGIRYCSRALLFVSGYYWISVKGKRDHKAPILVGNHVGLFESLFVVYAVLPSFIAKKGSEKAPFIGPVMEALQAVLVDRSSVTSR
jgi:1-acyl-sn-glycerol-3-phosphate acyltransferase